MTAAEMIQKYCIFLVIENDNGRPLYRDGKPVYTGQIGTMYGDMVKRDGNLELFKSLKPEIVEILMAEQAQKDKAEEERMAAEAKRKKKIDAIEGLAEIKIAQQDLADWQREFDASFEGENACGGLGVRPCPQYDLDAMLAMYPRAAAYLKAEKEADSTNYEIRAIGKRAIDRILDGDYQEALHKMEEEINDFCARHIWD